MKLEHVSPQDLRANPWNTNVVSPENMEKLKESLQRNGWVKPAIARETEIGLEILGGQHRVEAAIELQHETVPVFNLGTVDDTRAREIGLIDNARYGADDAIGLAELIDEIGGIGEIAAFMPFSDAEIAALATDITDNEIDNLLEDDDGDKEPPVERKIKTHQVMRMKVPVEDADDITETFELIMKEQGFTEEDSLTNAGDVLIHLVNFWKESGAS